MTTIPPYQDQLKPVSTSFVDSYIFSITMGSEDEGRGFDDWQEVQGESDTVNRTYQSWFEDYPSVPPSLESS